MRSAFAIIFALTLAVLVVNATTDVSETEQKNVQSQSDPVPGTVSSVTGNYKDNGDKEMISTSATPVENLDQTTLVNSATDEPPVENETMDISSLSQLDPQATTTTLTPQTNLDVAGTTAVYDKVDNSTISSELSTIESIMDMITTIESMVNNDPTDEDTSSEIVLTDSTDGNENGDEPTDVPFFVIQTTNSDSSENLDDIVDSLDVVLDENPKNNETSSEHSIEDLIDLDPLKNEEPTMSTEDPLDVTEIEPTHSPAIISVVSINVPLGTVTDIIETTDDISDGTSEIIIDTTMNEMTSTENSIVTDSTSAAPSKHYNFVVYGNSTTPCILANMEIILKVSYSTVHKKTVTKKISVPHSARVTGTCGEKVSYMTLTWTEGPLEGEDSIKFEILKDEASFYVNSVQATVFLDDVNFPEAADEFVSGNSTAHLRLFSASARNGVHVCDSVTEVPCEQIVALIKDVSFIAYNSNKDLSHRQEERCLVPKSVSVAAVIGLIVGFTVTVGIIASYAWYRKRTSTFRSELP